MLKGEPTFYPPRGSKIKITPKESISLFGEPFLVGTVTANPLHRISIKTEVGGQRGVARIPLMDVERIDLIE
jgi:hypothetical protein